MKKSLRITRNITLVLLLLLALVPLLASEGAKYGLRHYLQDLGMAEVKVGKLWFNPYTGYAELENIRFQHQGQPYQLELLRAELALRELWDKKIKINMLLLRGLNLDIVETGAGGLVVNGIEIPAAPATESDDPAPETDDAGMWNFAVVQIQLEQLVVVAQTATVNARLQVDKFTLQSLDTQLASEATLEGSFKLTELTLPESGLTLATRAKLNSRVKIGLTEQGWNVSGSNKIALAALDTMAAPYHLSAANMALEVDGDLDITEQLGYRAKATFTVQKLLLTETRSAIQSAVNSEANNTTNSDVTGEVTVLQLERGSIASSLNIDFKEQSWDLSAKNTLQLLAIQSVASAYQISADSVALEINTQLNKSTQLAYRGDVSAVLEKLALADHSSGASLLTLGGVKIDNVRLDSSSPEQILVTAVNGEGLVVLPAAGAKQRTLLDNGRFAVTDINLLLPAQEHGSLLVAIESLSLPQAEVQLLRTASGDFPQLQPLLSPAPQAPVAAASPAPPGTAVEATLTGTSVADTSVADTSVADTSVASAMGADAAGLESTAPAAGPEVTIATIQLGPEVNVRIEDRGVVPALKETVQFKEFKINNFSLSGSGNSQLQATLGLTHDAVLALTGDFNLAARSANLQANLKDYQVLQASGYSKRAIGYAVEAGTIDLNSSIKINDERMALDNKIRLDQLSLRAANDDKALNFVNQLAMPLDQALDLLRDNKNRIKLNVPVTGALNDPSVDFNGVINKALGGAMKKASISILKTLLEPYSTIFTVAKFAGEQISKVRLEPVKYAPGEGELSAQGRDYASKIATILTSRKKVKLKVCGVTNREDARLLATPVAATPVAPGADSQSPEPAAKPEANPAGQAESPVTAVAEVIDAAELANKLHSLAQQRSAGLRGYLVHELKVDKAQLLVCLPDHSEAKNAVAGIELLL